MTNKDNIEDLLLNNTFYSGPSENSNTNTNHVSNIRKSITKSPLISSLVAEKTSSMKISPSMKQLELILNEKHGNKMEINETVIEEEEEDNDFSYVKRPLYPSNPSNPSIQSFETAKSHESISTNSNNITYIPTNSSKLKSNGSKNSKNSSKNDFSEPVEVPPREESLQKLQGSMLDTSNDNFNDKSIDISENTTKTISRDSIDSQHARHSLKPRRPSQLSNSLHQTTSKESEKGASSYKFKSMLDDPTVPVPVVPNSHLKRKSIDSIKSSSMLENATNTNTSTKNNRKSVDSLKSSSLLENITNTNSTTKDKRKSIDSIKSLLDNTSTKNKRNSVGSLPQKSPHQRSHSTFETTLPANDKTTKLRRRSNTLGDIVKMNDASYDAPSEKKKFSFRSLFKSKSKSHALNDQSSQSSKTEPKAASKSFSTPNISKLAEPAPPTESERPGLKSKKSTETLLTRFKKTKSNDNIASFFENKLNKSKSKNNLDSNKKEEAATPIAKVSTPKNQQDEIVANPGQDSLRVVPQQKDRSIKSTSSSSTPRQRYTLTDESTKSPTTPGTRASSSVKERRYSHNVHDDESFDRNIKPGIIDDDEDDNDEDPYDETNNENMQEYQYDTKNLTAHPPKKIANRRYDEEILIVPPFQPDFGSPFNVDYTGSPADSPTKSVKNTRSDDLSNTHANLANLTINDSNNLAPPSISKKSDDKQEQLLGEALFPKSLSAQEVESIVSLERSRSMRSIRSNKRSSFVNYQGSDDNIIQFTGPPPSSPTPSGSIRRSGSILKNSGSRTNIDQELLLNKSTEIFLNNSVEENLYNLASPNLIDLSSPHLNLDSSIKQNYESMKLKDEDDQNFNDLFEFSDFIDIDNLSFSNSPVLPPDETFGKLVSPLLVNQPVMESTVVSPVQITYDLADDLKPEENSTIDTPMDTPNLQNITPTIPASQFDDKKQPPKLDTLVNEEKPDLSTSPILNKAILQAENSPLLNENGKSVFNNRPISMSFRGSTGPSFDTSLTQHRLRSSDSHQSFNISLDDVTDYSESEVGGGFGSSDEDDFNSDDSTNKENQRKPNYTTAAAASIKRLENRDSPLPRPTKAFANSAIPNIPSNSSSPRSFTSMISRKWKKAPNTDSPKAQYSIPAKNNVRFSSRIILYDTYNGEEYDRHPDTGTCNQLTPLLAQQIKDELNTFKSEMEIHTESQQYTHFF